jgi:hypothetical protein
MKEAIGRYLDEEDSAAPTLSGNRWTVEGATSPQAHTSVALLRSNGLRAGVPSERASARASPATLAALGCRRSAKAPRVSDAP